MTDGVALVSPECHHDAMKQEPQDDQARITLRIPKDVHKAVQASAKKNDRSTNGEIVALLRAALLPGKRS